MPEALMSSTLWAVSCDVPAWRMKGITLGRGGSQLDAAGSALDGSERSPRAGLARLRSEVFGSVPSNSAIRWADG